MKKFRKKGFTLVEIIVVMLILAILATMFIPNMLGYIERTEETTAIMECRSTVIASQTILNQTYAYKSAEFEGIYNNTVYTIKTSSYDKDSDTINLCNYSGMTDNLNGVICGLAESDGKVTDIHTDNSCRLKTLMYTSSNGKTVQYDSDYESGYILIE